MAELQAEIELSVELRKFVNIDLFAQGYYQIRTGVKFAPRIQSASKVEVKSELPPVFDDDQEEIHPAAVWNDCGVSKTFMIMYKKEQVILDDRFNFKLSVIVDPQNITESFNRLDMQLCVDLYFTDKEYSAEKLSTMQLLCSRCYKLQFNPRLGLHTHVPILFDYFHLSALAMTIHAALLCLIPPYVFDRPNVRQTSLFSFLFGQDLSQINTDQINPDLLNRAYQLHKSVCEVLLSSHESLQDFQTKMAEHLRTDEQKPAQNDQKCGQKLRELGDKIRCIEDIQTIDTLAHAHIAQCSAENIMLWSQFVDAFSLHDTVAAILAKEYHLKRVKRLSEGFLVRETPRINLLTNQSDTFNDLHELVRNSSYYSRLPHLPVECPELDGTPDTLPILVEEVYAPVDQQAVVFRDQSGRQTAHDLDQTHSPSNSGHNRDHSASSTARAPSAEPPKAKSSSASSSRSSSPIVRSSLKSFLSFRPHAQTNVNPVVALSNEPFVTLTAVRKLDRNPLASLKLKRKPSLNLLPTQPVPECNLGRRSNSLSISKATGRRSFSGFPFHRSNSAATANDTPDDSAVIPEFLRLSSDKADEDVFLTSDPDEAAAASTFGDSSMKSKVLRASYHGKANTLDRRMTNSSHTRTSSTSSANQHVSPKPSHTAQPEQITISLDNKPVNRPQEPVRPVNAQKSNDRPTLANAPTGNQRPSVVDPDRLQNHASINSQTIEYVVNKETLKTLLTSKQFSNLMFFSDLSTPTSPVPYFSDDSHVSDADGTHLIVCVHGLDGNSADLRLIRTYLELCLPSCHFDFLMSSSNHSSTFDDIDIMAKQLITEIDTYIDDHELHPQRISFVGHSLGNLVVRATVGHPNFARHRPLLYTYLSLSGPHLGTLFNTSGLVNAGMWIMQKWKKSCSLSQMSLKDATDPKQTFVYKLSKKPCFQFFKNVVLVASPQDRYVPFHSARIEVCRAALKDTPYGSIYVEMMSNLLEPILRDPSITFVRYNAFHNIPAGANNIIGRAAHIAILDSELFVEKLLLVSAAKYFK